MNNELIHADESKKLIQALIPERRKINSARPGERYHSLPVDNLSSWLSNCGRADNSQTIREDSAFSAPRGRPWPDVILATPGHEPV